MYPTYPNYDSTYSLLWGRELLDGAPAVLRRLPRADRASAGRAFGAVLAPLGDAATASWSLRHAGLASSSSSRGSTGSAAAAFTRVGSSPRRSSARGFDFPFLAARGYIDIPYLALVVWAAALEAERPRRGTPVLVLLLLARGLLRPEAWLLGGLYWLWLVARARPGASGPTALPSPRPAR